MSKSKSVKVLQGKASRERSNSSDDASVERNTTRKLFSFLSSKKKLPSNFTKKVVELEFKLEKGLTKGNVENDTINDLIKLYTKGYEYYDSLSKKDDAGIWQDKIHMLFMKPLI